LYAVDPGGATGAARGLFLPQATVAETLKAHAVEAREFRGDPIEQGWAIARDFLEWMLKLEDAGLSPRRIKLVFEGFNLRQMAVDLSPVEVTTAVRTALAGEGWARAPEFQSASQAKSFATGDRLKLWGLYDVGRGSDHKRDALRHLALGVSRSLR
jgi:DNA-binding transcriptional LysR family regulator